MKAFVFLAAAVVACLGVASVAVAQDIEKPTLDHTSIDPSPAEVALATQCRNAYDRMSLVKTALGKARDELNELAAKMTETGGQLDAAEKDFDEKKEKSSQDEVAYKGGCGGA